jgi:hypothetical protein
MARFKRPQSQPQSGENAEQDASEQQAATPGLRDEQLDADVECCLAEIDEVLTEAADEREKATAEFQELKHRWDSLGSVYRSKGADAYDKLEGELQDKFRQWQARYAHLGLSVRWCCGTPVMDEE